MKKINIFLITILFVIGIILNINPKIVKADSGFDTSYDSSSSFDWGSSSDWGSSFDWSSSGDSDLSDGGIVFVIFFVVIIVILLILVSNKQFTASNLPDNIFGTDDSNDVPDEEIKKIIPDFNREKFLKERFNDYVTIQNAWMNFDYDTLRSVLTDELYNQYAMQLDTLKVKNQKNVMSDFEYRGAKITEVNCENNQITIKMEMTVSFYDYIEQNGNVVRGNSNVKVTQYYEISFVCSMNQLDNCPNCGAKLEGNASNKCEYCGSIVSGLSNKWVMSKKESKRQR